LPARTISTKAHERGRRWTHAGILFKVDEGAFEEERSLTVDAVDDLGSVDADDHDAFSWSSD
jgi:hypothetical protein